MNALLNTTNINDKIGFICNTLIGKKSNSKGVLVNDEIVRLEKEVEAKISEIKRISTSSDILSNTEIEYEQLIHYPDNMKVLLWDEKNLTDYSTSEIDGAVKDIEALHSYINNEEDYKRLIWNNRIEKLLKDNTIADFIEYNKFIVDGKVDIEKIELTINEWDEVTEIFTRSSLFRSEPIDVEKFKMNDLKRLNQLIPHLIDFDMQLANNIAAEVASLQKSLSGKQVIISELESARGVLLQAKRNYDEESTVCPFCNKNYSDVEELNSSYEVVTEILNEEKGSSLKLINEKEKEFLALIKNALKKQIIRLEKLKQVRSNLDNLQKLYNSSIEDYKNIVLKKLRVPLLIYTGKILQDYQNGLGVFINKDEMRFVATGDAKHDILNTFSSGQLSGFVLAFLFAMNKQYIKESSDNIGFILIDDPVQTMDDINISSLIEVLRNDFSDKQIILSTHETEKENYILYKFYKYNEIGQSFNIKERLYGV